MILSYVTGLLVNVRAVGNTGIEMDSSATITMQGAFVEGSVTGIHCSVDTLDITHSRIDGGTNAIVRTGGTVTLDGVVMRGGPVSGTVTCTGCMRNGTFSASGCP